MDSGNNAAELLAELGHLRAYQQQMNGILIENEQLRKALSQRLQEKEELAQENERLNAHCADLSRQHHEALDQIEQLRKANEKLQTLVIWSVDTMSALHRAIEPMENDPELAGRVPPAAMRAFVDALASIDRERFVPHPKGEPTK